MARQPPSSQSADPIAEAAAQWIARRDRGLTPTEEEQFAAWCAADPRHSAAVRRHYELWNSLDLLQSCRPTGAAGEPDPDLLAPAKPSRRRVVVPFLAMATLAAAAAIAFWLRPASPPATPAPSAPGAAVAAIRVIRDAEAQTLADGTVVDLDRGAEIQPEFTTTARTVRLVRGEAHFTVHPDAARPFVVVSGSVYVRDVSTAFAVERAADSVRVLVTSGKVFVGRPALAGATAVVDGERADVDTTVATAAPVVTRVSAGDIERLLGWREEQLEFHDLPLSDVVPQFNRRNHTQVILGDSRVANLHVAGRFRADNVDAFVRLLEQSFGISAEHRPNSIILHAGRSGEGK
ncbi:MAG TPA: FecR domain-containing protein [Opitutaceae bacterium]|nr:FecR domain-containing protein [Opitutaceae bacterium]